jgi:uncharacterized membrane protein YfcA
MNSLLLASSSISLAPWDWLVVGLGVLVIGIAKSGFGGGVGILAVPMFVVAMGPKQGLGAMLPLMLAADIFSVYHHWGTWDRQNLRVLIPGTLLGIVGGTAVLAWLLSGDGSVDLATAEHRMKVTVGLICVLYVVGTVIRNRFAPHWRWEANWLSGTITGTAAGITSTIAHAGGPVMAIFLLGQHLSKRPFIGTTVIYFFLANAVKLLPYGYLGMIDTTTLGFGLWLLPLVPIGTLAGAHLNRVMSEGLFRGTIMAIVLVTGLKMVLS